MTVQILTIPENPAEWAGWMEQHLVGLRLYDLVEELSRIPGASCIPVAEILTEQELADVRLSGLRTLPVEKIRQLLSSPASLPELQEDVFVNGGDFWQTLPVDEETLAAANRVHDRVRPALVPEQNKAAVGVRRNSGTRFRRRLLSIAALAAALIVVVQIIPRQPAPSGRILGGPGLLANDVSTPDEYLNRLADAANTWFDERPSDSAELITLLREVSSDCRILSNASHPVLAAQKLSDGKTGERWLQTKCRGWKSEFDAALASLESGQSTFDDARFQADMTIIKLVSTLRKGPETPDV